MIHLEILQLHYSNFLNWRDIITLDIKNYPQYQLSIFTMHLYNNGHILIPKNCETRCIDSTIINRAYYASFLYCKEWLEDTDPNFRIRPKIAFDFDEKYVTEHEQVLFELKCKNLLVYNKLSSLKEYRRVADYEPY
ncbi:hypothetical protein [Methanobrevibacter sp. DSM 116169]|uniref:hypothetical protein n=1 Tax=Methanobrevibacter sp. DSM 116169 TaxID=3242727 RepID=UPI0038FBF494